MRKLAHEPVRSLHLVDLSEPGSGERELVVEYDSLVGLVLMPRNDGGRQVDSKRDDGSRDEARTIPQAQESA